MRDSSDMELVRDYARRNSEAAFAELAQRHVNLVYSVALRHAGMAAQAEEITQAVFIILARKAASLRDDTVVAAWLYETARFTALSFLRAERRRQFREQEAYMQSTLSDPKDDPAWHQIAPLLDEAMMRLGRKEREAVVLRFFKEKNFQEVAAALGIKEPAAQKRVDRALEKLNQYFSRRGISSTATVVAGEVAAHSVQIAPLKLAESVTVVAIGKGTAAGGATMATVKSAVKLMFWAKAKTAILLGVAAFLAVGATAVLVEQARVVDDSIDAKIARLSKPGTTAAEAVRVLGQPAKYGAGLQMFSRYDLPASYQMAYTNGVQVWVLQGKVKELESLLPGPGFSYHGRLRLSSSLDEVLQEIGPPADTISGQPADSVLGETLGGYAGVLYKDLNGVSGYDYYWRPDQNVRFIFKHDKVAALLLDVVN